MGISIWQLLIILAIVLVLFGAKHLRGVGSDLGTTIKNFKQAMNEDGAAVETSISPAPLKSATGRGKTNGA